MAIFGSNKLSSTEDVWAAWFINYLQAKHLIYKIKQERCMHVCYFVCTLGRSDWFGSKHMYTLIICS